MTVFVGVDPGSSGGVAAIDSRGLFLDAFPMPDDYLTMLNLIDVLGRGTGGSQERRAVVERVSASPLMGVVSAFSFGRNVGALRMALVASRIPFDEVTPVTWLRAMGLLAPVGERGKHGEIDKGKGRDKRISKALAARLFPDATVTHATAEALLLAEYARRVAAGLIVKAPPPKRRPKRDDATTELF